MILLIDNYDSFTHNLYQYLREITDEDVRVIRNDVIDVEGIAALNPSRIIISPGPGRPEDAGVSVEAVRRFAGEIPILGVCLGHQVIGAAFGGRIVQAKEIVHGKTQPMDLDGRGLFRSIDTPSTFTRYHSLVVEEASLPPTLKISARSPDGEIMGLRHREPLVEGVQFQPESIASDMGKKLLGNFLHYRREPFVYPATLNGVVAGQSLSRRDAENFMQELTEGNLTEAQIGAFLAALAAKGPSPEEIAGCAGVLQQKRVAIRSNRPILDTCGTGGDGAGTFNISSFAALIAAAAGATVAKHGNRAVSSKSGSADFYEALGMRITLTPAESEALLADEGFAFLFAPLYHQAMKYAAKPRRQLGVKTIMNLLGPLANPAGASYQLIGVYDGELCETVAEAARLLGLKRGLVVHGGDGLDEVSVGAETKMVFFDEAGTFETLRTTPEDLGIPRHDSALLGGGTAMENATLARALLSGQSAAVSAFGTDKASEALRDAVCINAGAALAVYEGIADSSMSCAESLISAIRSGYQRAREALESGAVENTLARIVVATTPDETRVAG